METKPKKTIKDLYEAKIKKLENQIYYLEIENEGMKEILKEKERMIEKLSLKNKSEQHALE